MDIKLLLLIGCNIILCALVYFTRRKTKLNYLVVFLFTFFFVLSLIEFAYRAFFKNESYYAADFTETFFRPDSLLGYTIRNAGKFTAIKKRNSDTIFKTIYSIEEDSSNKSRRYFRRVGFQNQNSPKEIVFIGCSFTFGDGLPDTSTLPYLTGKFANISSINFGNIGYGIHQVYQLFNNRYSYLQNNNRVFIYSFLYDHILRANGVYNWNLDGPVFKNVSDSLIHTGNLASVFEYGSQKYIRYASFFGAFSFIRKMLENISEKNKVKKLRKEDYEYCFMMLTKMALQIQKSGGKLILVDWDKSNWANDHITELPFQMIEDYLNKLTTIGVQVVRVSSIINLKDESSFIKNDGHPSAYANEKIAASLINTMH